MFVVMGTTDRRKQIYAIIEMYAPECSEPKKMCSSIEDLIDEALAGSECVHPFERVISCGTLHDCTKCGKTSR